MGYAGRILDDSQITPENPKYLFPETRERNGVIHRFDLTAILYNVHRAFGAFGRSEKLVVTDGFENAWRAHQLGLGRVVGLLGGVCSPTQAGQILRLVERVAEIDYFSGNAPSEEFWKAVGQGRAVRWTEVS